MSVGPKKWVGKLIMSLTPNRLKFFYQVFLDRKIILVRQCANKKLWWCVCVCFLGEGEGGCSPSSINEDTTQRQDFSGKFKRIIFKMRQLLVYPQTAQIWKRKKIILLLFPLSFFFFANALSSAHYTICNIWFWPSCANSCHFELLY